VLLVEDNTFTRATVRGALENAGLIIVGDTGIAAESLDLARRHRPDAALVDLDLGDGPSGVEVAKRLRQLLPLIGLVILTTYEDPRLMGYQMDQLPPATGYLVKGTLDDTATLALALAASVANARVPTVQSTQAVLGEQRSSAQLSDAQVAVLRLVAAGLSNAEIARQRVVTEKSVERLIMRTCRELDIPSDSATNRRVLLTREYVRLSAGKG
jgi:DNA-binding NarL/FixJ family response regulator